MWDWITNRQVCLHLGQVLLAYLYCLILFVVQPSSVNLRCSALRTTALIRFEKLSNMRIDLTKIAEEQGLVLYVKCGF